MCYVRAFSQMEDVNSSLLPQNETDAAPYFYLYYYYYWTDCAEHTDTPQAAYCSSYHVEEVCLMSAGTVALLASESVITADKVTQSQTTNCTHSVSRTKIPVT